jgi:hypothetical protein
MCDRRDHELFRGERRRDRPTRHRPRNRPTALTPPPARAVSCRCRPDP